MAQTDARVDVTVVPGGAPRYGLLNVASGPNDLPAHAGYGGLQYDLPVCGNTLDYYPVDCAVDPRPELSFDEGGVPVVDGDPFVVYASVVCKPIGIALDRFRQIATDRLIAGEQYGVEKAFWQGTGTGGIAGIVDGTDVTTLTAATSVVEGVAALEEFLYTTAAYPYPGIIHALPSFASYAAAQQLLRQDGAVKRTPYGTAWSFGAGYGANGPGDTAPAAGSVWLLATGAVRAWRAAEPFVPDPAQVMDRKLNDVSLVAEREWVLAHDCRVAAIQVAL